MRLAPPSLVGARPRAATSASHSSRLALGTIGTILVSILVSGCHRAKAADPVEVAALAAVEAARSPAGLGPELVDADLIEAIRRVQVVKRASWDSSEPKVLLEAFGGDFGPDRKYAPAERPAKQRDRASRGIRGALIGPCTAKRWDTGKTARVKFLLDPLRVALPEVAAAQVELGRRLATSELARVSCKTGELAFFFARPAATGEGKATDGPLRLVDVFSTAQTSFEVHPNDSTMK